MTMTTRPIDTVIVGGGQAGLAMSYYLRQQGRGHVALERAPVLRDRRNGWLGDLPIPYTELEQLIDAVRALLPAPAIVAQVLPSQAASGCHCDLQPDSASYGTMEGD